MLPDPVPNHISETFYWFGTSHNMHLEKKTLSIQEPLLQKDIKFRSNVVRCK